MAGVDVPFFLVHLDHQSRLFRIEVFDKKGKAWHRAYNEEYLGRNSTATGFFALPFDGTTLAGNKVYTVPNGEYYVTLSVLKALGDAEQPGALGDLDVAQLRDRASVRGEFVTGGRAARAVRPLRLYRTSPPP